MGLGLGLGLGLGVRRRGEHHKHVEGRLLQRQARLELGVQAVDEHRGERGLRREHRVQVRL